MLKTRGNRFNRIAVIFVHVLLIITTVAFGKRVPLLDTTHESTLHWTTHSASSSAEDGWLEESYTNAQEGSNWRSYVVCDVRREHVDNWVRAPFIQRGEARRLSVEMTFTMRDCKMFPHTARTCKETFTLMAYEADFDFATKELPEWDDRQASPKGAGFKRIDRITADNGRFTSKDNIILNTETRIVPVSKKGVYLAFRDEGACISLLAVKIYYEVCEEVVTNFAWFPETAVGANLTSIQEAVGHCVDNASPPSPGAQPKYVCKADGTWDLLSGGCQCNPGYRPDGARCLACASGSYKENPGLAGCVPCPINSVSKNPGAAFCNCEAGFYRAPADAKSSPCTRPPSRPIDLKLLKVETTRAVLSWKQPEDLGGRPMLWYSVDCPECPADTQFLPAKKMFNTTTLTLTSLAPASLYTVFVYAENEITPQVDSLPMYAVIDFTTQNLPSSSSGAYVIDLRVDAVTSNEMNISWTVPVSAYTSEIVKLKSSGDRDAAELESNQHHSSTQIQYFHFVVRLFMKDSTTQKRKLVPPNLYRANGNNETAATNVPKFTFYDLQADTEYGYQVQVVGSNGEPGAWSDLRWARTAPLGGGAGGDESSRLQQSNNDTVTKTIWSVLGFLLLSAACFAIYWFLRRRKRAHLCSGEKQPSDLDVLEYKSDPLRSIRHHSHSDSTPEYNSAATLSRKMVTPLVPPFAAPATPFHTVFKQYVDPLAYEDPNQVLQEFANEVDRSRVVIEEIIGMGEFGEVCKGKLAMPGGREETVAIKTLKAGSTDKVKDFLTEASIMGQFDHPNVIKLKGVVTKSETAMIITEYMENRSLDKFLRENDGRLDVMQLVTMLHGIANGMKYLSDKGFVHRDLAARNVLVDASFSCKIADFGLSRGTEGSIEQVYTTKGGKIPVRWTAPEAIAFRKFTTKSDVWSFGVVMWEVMSYGERPYWNWTNHQVVQAIEQHDFRLPSPMDCPNPLHQLMMQCWQREREQRPTFADILQVLQGFLRCPELLYTSSTASSISSPLGVSHSGGSFASLTSSAALPSLCGGIGLGGHRSTGTSSGFVSAAASSGAYQTTNSILTPASPVCCPATLDTLLRDVGLERFLPIFYRHGCRNVNDAARLTSVDMALLGLQPHEHKKITDALHRLHRSSAFYPQRHSPLAQQHASPCPEASNVGFFV